MTLRVLIGTETLLASLLVSLSVVVGGTFYAVATLDLGLDPRNVLAASIRVKKTSSESKSQTSAALPSIDAFVDLERGAAHLPGVVTVATADLPPIGVRPSMEEISVDEGVSRHRTSVRRVGVNYFDALRIRLMAGRVFSREELLWSPPTVAIVSERFAQVQFAGGSAVGRVILDAHARPLRVVGVVSDVRYEGVNKPLEATVYVPYTDPTYRRYFGARTFLIRTGRNQQTEADRAFRSRALQDSRIEVLSVRPISEDVLRPLEAPRLYALLTGMFGGVGLLLAIGGTFSCVRQVIMRRKRDTAIRMAYGAQRSDVVLSLMVYGGTPVVLGLLLGLAPGAFVGKAMTHVVFLNVRGEVGTGVAVGITLLLVLCGAFAALLLPAVQAARRDPLDLLRHE